MVQRLVDSRCAKATRTIYLRSVFESRVDFVVLAMASVRWRGVVCRRPIGSIGSAWFFCVRLGAGSPIYFPDQSLRSVRIAPGLAVSSREALHHSEIWNTRTIYPGSTPALCGL